MAKYLAYYSLSKMTADILEYRVGQIDVSEDLVFYYLNLKLFYPILYETESFRALVDNALTPKQQAVLPPFPLFRKGWGRVSVAGGGSTAKDLVRTVQHNDGFEEKEKKQSGLNKL